MAQASLAPWIAAAKARPRDGFRPRFEETQSHYRVRFAQGAHELEPLFRLRYEVFNLELGEGLEESVAAGLDTDPFDEQCDHLLVEDLRAGRVIGTYRVQVSEMAEAGIGYYTATEYDLSSVTRSVLPDAVECGRACVARSHRNKIVLYLLFRGLASYALWNGRRYFFGCSSLTSQDPAEGLRCQDHLARERQLHPEIHIPAQPAYQCVVDGHSDDGSHYDLPTLFHTYLRFGATICSEPALDRFFGTIDFLTLVDLEAVSPRVVSLFFAGQEGGPA